MGLFGLSLGFNKTKTKGTLNSNTLETGTQTEDSTKNTNTTSSTQQNQQGQQSTTSGSQTSNTTGQQQTGQEAGSTASTSKSFSDSILASLESVINGKIGSTFGTGDALAGAAEGVLGFDPETFVNGIVTAAKSKQGEADSLTNNLNDNAIGGTASTNSMAALLADKTARLGAESLAGIESGAVKTAAEIQQGGLTAAAGADVAQQNALTQLVTALKGGSSSTNVDTLSNTLNELLGTSNGSTTASEDTKSASSSNTDTVTQMTELLKAIQSLTNQTTVDQKTTGSSLSIEGKASAGK